MAQPKIFVSHSHEDDAFAERLVKDLRAAGADAWLDKTDLGAGDFQARISAALGGCEWFVLVLTRSALASKWVIQEVNAANSLKHQGRIRDLIFIKAGPVEHRELPALWSVYNIFDATADYVAARNRVLRATGVAAQKMPAPREPNPTPIFSSRPIEEPDSAPSPAPRKTFAFATPGEILGMALEMRKINNNIAGRKFAEALEACEGYLHRHPTDSEVWRLKAKALRGLGRNFDAAAAELEAMRLE